MVSSDFAKQMAGYGLVTAHILYRMPDHPSFLQSYIWQEYDVSPRFPELNKFLEFWQRELDGPLHEVRIVHQNLIKPAELRHVGGVFQLH